MPYGQTYVRMDGHGGCIKREIGRLTKQDVGDFVDVFQQVITTF